MFGQSRVHTAMTAPRHIGNSDLRLDDVPLPAAEIREIGRFADSLPPADHADNAKTLLAETVKNHAEKGTLPESLSELRTCLAMQWAILPYVAPAGPNAKQEQFLQDLVAKIRRTLGGQD